MFFVYLFATVVGCLLVLVSVLSGGHGDASADGGDVAVDAAADTVSAGDGGGHGHHGPEHAAAASSLGSSLGGTPLKVLTRGYAVAKDQAGRVLTDAETVDVGSAVSVTLACQFGDPGTSSVMTAQRQPMGEA